jgi:tetratricopeptide (TPR) repeat protein
LDSHKYVAFLSYSHRDAKWGGWLHKALESYRPPRQLVGTLTARGPVPKRLSPVFRDREELASATDLGSLLREALQLSACQIVICSPSSARSKWVNEEILSFKRLGREDRIFCLIVDGEPYASGMPGREDEECFPPALRFKLGPDGELSSVPTEPIAADARPGKDGRNNAKLKLIAGLLGVGFDALRQREQHRRQRQLFAIASGAIAGMVLTSGLAAAALIARAAAQRQTAIARREAETARRTTDFLVGLFRVSDPSEARGNSYTAREMLDRGAAGVETQLATQPKVQATLLDSLGQAYTGLGLYDKAEPLLESAVSKRRRLTPAEPAEEALSLRHLGDLQTLRATYPQAESVYRNAIDLQSALPPNQRDELALACSLFGLGDEQVKAGHSAEAEKTLNRALEIQQHLYTETSVDCNGSQGHAKADVARTLQTLAYAIRERDLNEAIPIMRSAVAIQQSVWGDEPYPDYAAALNDLAVMLKDQGDYAQSEQLFMESLAMERKLLGDKHADLAAALNNLGVVQRRKGDLTAAEATYHEALAMQRELLGEVHPEVANTLNNLAFVRYERGDLRGAIQIEGESLDIYRKLFPGDSPDVARTMNRLGYWQIETHDYSAASHSLEDALAMRRRLFGPSHLEVASSLMHVGILQVAMHQYADALASERDAVQIYSAALSAKSWRTGLCESVAGAALSGMGKYSEAERQLLEGYGILSNDTGTLPMYRALARHYLEGMYLSWGRPGDARRYAPLVVASATSSSRSVN